MPRVVAVAAAIAWAFVACGEPDRARPEPGRGSRSSTEPTRPAVQGPRGALDVHLAGPEQPPARLVRWQGEVQRARGTIVPGQPLEAGEFLAVRGEGRADVDLAEGGRIVLGRDTEVRIGDGGPAQVILLRGALHALVPPGPGGPRPPLRVACPAASVDLGGSGEFFVLSHASGGAWVASLAGMTTVTTGEVDARRRLRVVELPPARSLTIASRMAEPADGPTRLDEAHAMAATVFGDAAPVDAARARRDLLDAAARLDEATLWLETETRAGRDLTTNHREAVRAGRAEDAMRLQRELVTHAQRLHALRQVVAARWERLLAGELQLARLPGAPRTDLVASRRDRVGSLLGF